MTRVTTRHNGSQRVTNLPKTSINTVSQGHNARHKSQILIAGVAQELCDPSHNGSQLVTNLTKTKLHALAQDLAPRPARSLKSAQDKSFSTFFLGLPLSV